MGTKSWSVVWTGWDGMCAAADHILSFCSLFFQRVLRSKIPRMFFLRPFCLFVLFVRFVCPGYAGAGESEVCAVCARTGVGLPMYVRWGVE